MINPILRHHSGLSLQTACIAFGIALVITSLPVQAAHKLEGKVVLANVDRHTASFRVGKVEKKIASRKASVLSPKKYPISLDLWSGNRTLGWQRTAISGAGIYTLRFQGGKWTLAKHTPRTRIATTARRPTTTRRTYSARPTYSRSTGSRTRVVQRGGGARVVVRPPVVGGYWPGHYWSPIERGIWAAAKIYQFVRDEEDRDLLRRIIIDREIDDRVRRELEDRLRDRLIALPHEERRELERAWDELDRLSDDDWKQAETLPADEWDRIRERLGDEISDDDWRDLKAELYDVGDNLDVSTADIENLDEAGLEDLEQGIDIDDLGGADLGDLAGDVDLGDLAVEDVDVGDFALDAEELDVGDLGIGDWGGFDSGGLDAGGLDAGGWDSYDAGDFGWGGGGDIGGGDWGGGLDAGGFDDFGGGFDDFGGGFDLF